MAKQLFSTKVQKIQTNASYYSYISRISMKSVIYFFLSDIQCFSCFGGRKYFSPTSAERFWFYKRKT